MLSLLKKGPSANKVPAEKIQATYGRYRMQALLSVFLGYLAYYIVRNNFTLSTPYLKEQLDLSATQIGLLSSCMLIAYGISKGVMSSLADKASPKVFMACGLVLCAIVNVGLGFSTAFWVFAALVVLNGLFQGMGVGPSFITIANWFPRRERGRVGAFWNISHNVGGGIVAPIVGAAFAILGTEHWQSASYIVPACVAVVFAISVLVLGKGSPREEGLPSLAEMMPEEKVVLKTKHGQKAPEHMSAFQIFCTYVLRNKNAWYVSFVDVFVYMVRFGMISWLPIYLLTVKHFSKEQMSVATATWHTGATDFLAALADSPYAITYMPAHAAATDFPLTLEALQEWDTIILSDIGANTLLLHPDTWLKSRRTANRLTLLHDYVAGGGALMMIGGYYSFQGINGGARYRHTAVEKVLPVRCLAWDDRIETPEGCYAEVTESHPLFNDIPGEWPWLLGYNEVEMHPEGKLLATVAGTGHPLLAVREYQQGRSLVWTSDMSAHWLPEEFAKWPGYRQLWINCLDWLTERR